SRLSLAASPAPTHRSTLSLHDALPILSREGIYTKCQFSTFRLPSAQSQPYDLPLPFIHSWIEPWWISTARPLPCFDRPGVAVIRRPGLFTRRTTSKIRADEFTFNVKLVLV